MAYDSTKDEFLEWSLLDRRTREINGLPKSQAEFAKWKGITPRTVSRWKNDPEFAARMEQRQLEEAQRLTPNATVSSRFSGGKARRHDGAAGTPRVPETVEPEVAPEGVQPDEWDYQRIKATIARRAIEENNRDAQDLWMKHWGKTFVEAEAAEDESLSGLSDDELVEQIIGLVGVETVSRVLVRQQVSE